MKIFLAIFSLTFFLGAYQAPLLAKEFALKVVDGKIHEFMTVVKSVSSSKRLFMIPLGARDGIYQGLVFSFGNDHMGLNCAAVEVNRYTSLWEPVGGDQVLVSFHEDEYLSVNSAVYGNIDFPLKKEMPNFLSNLSSEAQKERYGFHLEEKYKHFRIDNQFTLNAGFIYGLSAVSSNSSSNNSPQSNGLSFGLDYNIRLLPEWEMLVGMSIDTEVIRIQNPMLDMPTKRYLGKLGTKYHLLSMNDGRSNMYFGMNFGFGSSETIVNNIAQVGHAILLPEVMVGFLYPLTPSTAFIVDLVVDSLNINETLPDNSVQTTNSLIFKLNMGFRF